MAPSGGGGPVRGGVVAAGIVAAAAEAAVVAVRTGTEVLGRVAWMSGVEGRGKGGGMMSRFLQHVMLRYVAGASRTI